MRGANVTFGLLSLLCTRLPRSTASLPCLFQESRVLTLSWGIQPAALEKLFPFNNDFLSGINCILGSNLTCGLIANN